MISSRFPVNVCRFSHSSISPIAPTNCGYIGSNSNFIVGRCFSHLSSSSSSPSVSVSNMIDWHEPVTCPEVDDDSYSDEDNKPSIPVRAYFFSTSVDLKLLVDQNRPNFIPPTSRMTNYFVLRFGNSKPEVIKCNLKF